MADYLPLLNRSIANLASEGTSAARHAFYERARNAQQVQLRTQHPPLLASDIAREEEALEKAIASVEARFGGAVASPAETRFATRASVAVSQDAVELATADAVRPETFISFKPPRTDRLSAGAERSETWRVGGPTSALAGLFAVLLGAVLALAGAAIVMRDAPRDLLAAPSETPQEPPPERPSTTTLQPQPSLAGSDSIASTTGVPQPERQSGAEPAIQTRDTGGGELPKVARAALLIASDNPKSPTESFGKTVWSIIPPAPGSPATVAVKADADIPDLKMRATMTLRRNTDPALHAAYTIDLKFAFDNDASIHGVKNVEPMMRNLGSNVSDHLSNVKVKVSDTYFLVALVDDDKDAEHNLTLMKTRDWFDFPLLLEDDRIAKLLFEKSLVGQAMLTKVFAVWNEAQAAHSSLR
jgi:hypothetical protein